MSSPSGSSPEPRDVRASLRQVRDVEEAVRGIETPWWYFVLSAGLFALLVLTQLSGDRASLWMSLVATSIVVLNLLAARQAGVLGAGSRNYGFLTALLLIVVVFLVSLVWYESTGETSIVLGAAATAAVLMLIGGWLYRRRPS